MSPTDTFIQSLAQGGTSVALALTLCVIVAFGAFCALGVWLERKDREHQRRLAEAEFRHRPTTGPHWTDQHLSRRSS